HSIKSHTFHPLNAFSFLRIANHFFPDFEFEDFKVDGFVDRITDLYPGISRGRFNYYMRETIARVKEYKSEMAFELNPYTVMRHCLYLADPNHFTLMLNDDIRSNFKNWMEEKELKHVVEVTSD
ncbi:MAG: (p)ppGpp synthetase, partial [Pseudomonadota bacterium]